MTDTSVPASSIKDIDKYNEAKTNLKKILDENPLAIVPIDMYGTVKTEDPFNIVEFFKPTVDDIEEVVSGVIGAIPIVGQVMGVVFKHFWKAFNDDEEEKLEKRLKEFKKEILDIVDKKIEKSEIDQWKRNCDLYIKSMEGTLETLKDALTTLRYQLVNHEKVDPASKESIRTKLDILRNDVKKVLVFTSDEKYAEHTILQFMQAMFLNIFLFRAMDSYWYQWGIPEIDVVGRPATDKSKALKSLREKLHKRIQEGANHIDKYCKNDAFLKNAHLIIKNDILMYPVPLVVGKPFNAKDSLDLKLYELDSYNYMPELTIPEHSLPFIFRQDASCLRLDPRGQNISRAKANFKFEPWSACHGQLLFGGLALKVKVPKSFVGKKVILRFMLIHGELDKVTYRRRPENKEISVSFGSNHETIPTIKEQFPIQRKFRFPTEKKLKKESGLTYTSKKFKIESEQTLNISHEMVFGSGFKVTGKILFVEFLISDC